MKTFGFTPIKKGIVQPVRVSWKHIPQASIVNTPARKQSMVEKTEDTIYQKHYVSEEKLTRLLNKEGTVE